MRATDALLKIDPPIWDKLARTIDSTGKMGYASPVPGVVTGAAGESGADIPTEVSIEVSTTGSGAFYADRGLGSAAAKSAHVSESDSAEAIVSVRRSNPLSVFAYRA